MMINHHPLRPCLLSPFRTIAYWRFVNKDELDAAEHEVLMRLIELLP